MRAVTTPEPVPADRRIPVRDFLLGLAAQELGQAVADEWADARVHEAESFTAAVPTIVSILGLADDPPQYATAVRMRLVKPGVERGMTLMLDLEARGSTLTEFRQSASWED